MLVKLKREGYGSHYGYSFGEANVVFETCILR